MNLRLAQDYRHKQLEIFERLEKQAAAGSFGSFIPMTEDFANDNRVSLAAIKFLPRALSESIYEKLVNPLIECDREQFYFAKESLHMTVQNVRKINDRATFGEQEVQAARGVLEKLSSTFAPFEFSLEGLLVMPASIAIRAIAEPRFAQFSRLVRDELKAAGVADDKPYIDEEIVFGNITFCRYTHAPTEDFLTLVDKFRSLKFGTFKVDSFELMTTNSICDLKKTVSHQKFLLNADS